MRESQIEKFLVEKVKDMGGEVRKVQWIGRNGAPDRLVMLPYRVTSIALGERTLFSAHRPASLWVEVKAPGEKPRPSQLREHDRMRAMGQRVVVIDSIAGVEELLA